MNDAGPLATRDEIKTPCVSGVDLDAMDLEWIWLAARQK